MADVCIDPEFRRLIPPLGAEERQQLEQSLPHDGCYFALQNFGGLVFAQPRSKEARVHRHLCSHCAAVITLDEDGKCQSKNDHTDGPCEASAYESR